MTERTLFDMLIFDRPHYRRIKPRHPDSTVPFILSINLGLLLLVAALIGVIIGSYA